MKAGYLDLRFAPGEGTMTIGATSRVVKSSEAGSCLPGRGPRVFGGPIQGVVGNLLPAVLGG